MKLSIDKSDKKKKAKKKKAEPAAKKTAKKSSAAKEVQRNARFIHEPPKAGLKLYNKYLTAKAALEAAETAAQEALVAVAAAFEKDSGFSFLDENGEFITIMPRTRDGALHWFTRKQPVFAPGVNRGGRPAAPKAKKEKAAKGEKKPAKSEKPAKAKKSADKPAKKKTKKVEAPAE